MLKVLDRVADGEHWVGQTLAPWHVSIGSVLLLLIVVRVAWVLKQLGHRPQHSPAETFLGHTGIALLHHFARKADTLKRII